MRRSCYITIALTVAALTVSLGWGNPSLAQSDNWVRTSTINYDRSADDTTAGHAYRLAARTPPIEQGDLSDGSGYIRSEPRAVAPFPIRLNEFVRKYLAKYLHAPAGLQNSFNRSAPYLAQMVDVLQQNKIPPDLVYLAFAESAFSKRGDGPWQLTKTTAREYGLKINSYVDERRDPVMSTRAAAKYLAHLHEASDGDWTMTLIAWNNGEGTLDKYWSLRGPGFEQFGNLLPQHTRSLLGRFMAVDYIARHAGTYGIVPASLEEAPAYRTVRVSGGTSLTWLAFEHGTTLGRLRELNPALLRDITPPYARSYAVRIPIVQRTYSLNNY
ncbi:MAG: transglycosylase SLT domain-containing protein [Candidatus Binataceae bacterium]